MQKGHLFFIMGVSGSGKGTLRKNLESSNIKKLEFLRSYVTRLMRPGEINGHTYWFISEEEFRSGIAAGDFLEYEWVHDAAFYGTKKSEVEAGLEAKKILMKEIDTNGLKQLHEKHPDFTKNYTSFFLDVPDEILRYRFFDRNPSACETDFENRRKSAAFEREHASEYCDYIIDGTQHPDNILEQVLDIIETHTK